MAHTNDIAQSLGVQPEAFTDKATYIRSVREGVPGTVVKSLIKLFNNRDLIVRVLNTSSANLSRIYQVKHMSPRVSEEVLDMIRLYKQAIAIFGTKESAIEWIKTPNTALAGDSPEALFDTFEGRQWVSQTLRKIEHGEFS